MDLYWGPPLRRVLLPGAAWSWGVKLHPGSGSPRVSPSRHRQQGRARSTAGSAERRPLGWKLATSRDPFAVAACSAPATSRSWELEGQRLSGANARSGKKPLLFPPTPRCPQGPCLAAEAVRTVASRALQFSLRTLLLAAWSAPRVLGALGPLLLPPSSPPGDPTPCLAGQGHAPTSAATLLRSFQGQAAGLERQRSPFPSAVCAPSALTQAAAPPPSSSLRR